MSNVDYTIGSEHRSRDLSEKLPRETGLMPEDKPLNFFIGCFWALITEVGAGLVVWLLFKLLR
jgi:hypothetical protein